MKSLTVGRRHNCKWWKGIKTVRDIVRPKQKKKETMQNHRQRHFIWIKITSIGPPTMMANRQPMRQKKKNVKMLSIFGRWCFCFGPFHLFIFSFWWWRWKTFSHIRSTWYAASTHNTSLLEPLSFRSFFYYLLLSSFVVYFVSSYQRRRRQRMRQQNALRRTNKI